MVFGSFFSRKSRESGVAPVVDGKRSSLDVLATLHRRPTSEEVIGLEDKHILESAATLGLPIDREGMKPIFDIHEKALPLIEHAMAGLLKTDQAFQSYYPLARDGEIIYDALWALGRATGSTLQRRVHYTKTSNAMKSVREVAPEYFYGIGISPERAKNGPPMVFIDSGFWGSLFGAIARWTGIPTSSIPNDNFRGYMVCCQNSSYNQLALPKDTKGAKEFLKMIAGSPIYKDASCGADLPNRLCSYIQLMPKYTGRFVQTVKVDGKWDVMPQENKYVSDNIREGRTTNDRCVGNNSDQINSLSDKLSHVNADVVDPVASILLQRRTLEYFSDPNVHDRVYSRSKVY
ncbi:Uncharacterised protein [uncultured archaeon]|nr:Uncharacterised protein [uncultured archaeon]